METPISSARRAKAGTAIWNEPNVRAHTRGLILRVAGSRGNQLAPPSTDVMKNRFCETVSGQTANTSPAALVVMSLPMAVPLVSAPLTWVGACQPDDRRRLTKAGRLLCQMT